LGGRPKWPSSLALPRPSGTGVAVHMSLEELPYGLGLRRSVSQVGAPPGRAEPGADPHTRQRQEAHSHSMRPQSGLPKGDSGQNEPDAFQSGGTATTDLTTV
jgi:hypothetical protein